MLFFFEKRKLVVNVEYILRHKNSLFVFGGALLAIPSQIIQEITDKCDIVDFISKYVRLKRSSGEYVGLCPFHGEKTPSFHVSADKQLYHCFGCGEGGTIINFVMKMENLSFVEAVKFLGERVGVAIPETTDFDDKAAKRKQRLYEINKEAGRFFYSQLGTDEGKIAREYFNGRGLSKETIVKFGLGFAPDSWDKLFKHLKAKGFTEYEALDAGLIVKSQKGSVYDRFRNRVMFPIFDIRGNLIAFGGRVLDDSKPKYLNTNDTPVFDKSSNLFALNLAKKSNNKTFVVVEGYMDVITLHQYGIDTAVASLGTSLTDGHANLLKRYAEAVVLCYDSDEAGVKAANRGMEILSRHDIKTKIITLPGSKDPDEFCRKNGADAFLMAISGAKNPILYKIGNLKAKYDLNEPDQKVEFIKEAALELVKLNSQVEQEIYAKEISVSCDVSFESVMAQLKQKRKSFVKKETKKELEATIRDLSQKTIVKDGKNILLTETEEKIINLMFYSHQAFEFLSAKYKETDFSDELLGMMFKKITELKIDKSDISESEFISHFEMENASRIAKILNIKNSYPDPRIAATQISQSLDKLKKDIQIKDLAKSHDMEKVKQMISERNRKED